MDPSLLNDPALTVALALAAGMLAQTFASHLRLPGIVVLLATGVLLGPDGLGLIHPEALGDSLEVIVGFAVAVILFEGGMNLDLKGLRRQARSIRQLVTWGAMVTAVGGTLAARFIMQWDWTRAALFGTLVIVTGPTVITPLLRRIRVQRKVATVLEAEGVFGDAIGAILAVVALEIALSPSGQSLALGAWDVIQRLGFGVLMGGTAGLLVALFLRFDKLLPEGLENVFTLAMALALFQGSNTLVHESGIVSVTIAGLVVGNVKTRALKDLREFKEQLTVLFIGMLFVLLAADVRIEDVQSLGRRGLLTVLALMFVVRPLNVLAGTWGADLNLRQRAFLAWLAPRGIVAAAVASLFAQSLEEAGIRGGPEFRALVFLVIGVTVLVQGLSGGLIAQWLGIRRTTNTGFVILGANALARCVAGLLRDSGEDVVLIDSNPDACRAAEEDGFRVFYGSALSERLLQQADLDGRAACVGLTPNDAVNLLFATRARQQYKVPRLWVAIGDEHSSVKPKDLGTVHAHVLFGGAQSLELWAMRLERNLAKVERWVRQEEEQSPLDGLESPWGSANQLLPLAVSRGKRLLLVDENVEFQKGDELFVLVQQEGREATVKRLIENAWAART